MSDFRLIVGKESDTERKIVKSMNQEPSLKGTFVSVLLLGGFIAISWIGVFALFIARN
jgi:hypothetical protein